MRICNRCSSTTNEFYKCKTRKDGVEERKEWKTRKIIFNPKLKFNPKVKMNPKKEGEMETEIKLEKTKFTVLNYIAEELWKANIALNEPDLQITQYISHMMSKEILIRLSCKFLTRDEGEYEFKWYKSWWQELRKKILPKWWIRQYPIKMEIKKKIKCIATYPSIKIYGIEHKSYIDFI